MNCKRNQSYSPNWMIALSGTLGVMTMVVYPPSAKAILHTNGSLDGQCAWANVVHLKNSAGTRNCSGTLVAPNAILTSGHCGPLSEARFGEVDLASGNGAQVIVSIRECIGHPTYQPMHFSDGNPGVDLQICIIEEDDWPAIVGIPIVPIMVPTGPARDWLSSEIYSTPLNENDGPKVWMVGSGCNSLPCDDDGDRGNKYEANVPASLFRQRGPRFAVETSTTVLQSRPQSGSSTEKGDSGGPAFVKMRDGTWRLIGALHSDLDPTEHEAAPSHLAWIEHVSTETTTTTPCHDFNSVTGEWTWTGPCTDVFPTDSDISGSRSWDTNCAGVSTGGGLYAAANNYPSPVLDKEAKPDSGGDSLWVPLSVLDDAYDDALVMATNGDFGSPPEQQQVMEYFIAQAAWEAGHPFVANVYVADKSSAYPTTLLTGDFNGDDEEDQVYADPYHNCGKGRVFSLAVDGTVVEWDRDTTGILGTAACGDYFGASITVADFNGDGYDDVAVGAPGSMVGSARQAGSISVIYGSSVGLTASGDQLLDQDTRGILGTAEPHDFFGHALTAADYNCDGYDDVAIGVPREDIGSNVDAGAFHVIYGSATGLSANNSMFYQGSGGVNDTAENGDLFGSSLASGNFNGDVNSATGIACFDLAVGAPAEDIRSVVDAGYVYILDGGPTGLTTVGDQGLSQGLFGVSGLAEMGDFFGMNLEVAHDGTYDGLIVQVPGKICSSTYIHPVGEHRFHGSSQGISTRNDETSCFDMATEYTMSTMEWGVLAHAADNYAIQILNGSGPVRQSARRRHAATTAQSGF
jgi:hypothetical protein